MLTMKELLVNNNVNFFNITLTVKKILTVTCTITLVSIFIN